MIMYIAVALAVPVFSAPVAAPSEIVFGNGSEPEPVTFGLPLLPAPFSAQPLPAITQPIVSNAAPEPSFTGLPLEEKERRAPSEMSIFDREPEPVTLGFPLRGGLPVPFSAQGPPLPAITQPIVSDAAPEPSFTGLPLEEKERRAPSKMPIFDREPEPVTLGFPLRGGPFSARPPVPASTQPPVSSATPAPSFTGLPLEEKEKR